MRTLMPATVALAPPVLEIAALSASYGGGAQPLQAVRNVSFSIAPGEAYGLIGESGSGKTTIAYAVMRHVRDAQVRAERIALQGRDVLRMNAKELTTIRGRQVAMIYQDPMGALNPVLRIGEQVAEVLRRHRGLSRTAARARTIALLEQVHLPDPAATARRYPHQLSGGQQQRVVIAMAIACEPELLIMDEPTTALDVTTEAVILDLIRELRRSIGAAVLFISHNLAVVANVCDRVGVLYAGQLVEEGTVQQVLRTPRHPYTLGLLASIPRADGGLTRLRAIPGGLPDLRDIPTGCIFRARCDDAFAACGVVPQLVDVTPGHARRCHLGDEAARPIETYSTPRSVPRVEDEAAGDQPRLAIEGLTRWFRPDGAIPFLARVAPVRAVTDVT
ncbi:MAG: ABC transporter ATP-binding protein, partial [Acetobacteraceae bacterium]